MRLGLRFCRGLDALQINPRLQAALRRLPEALTAGELARGFRAGDLTKQLGEEGVEGALGAELVGSAQVRRRKRWINQVNEQNTSKLPI